MKPFVCQLDAAEYHADQIPNVGDTPCLSASIAKVLESKSPRHAYARHPKLGGTQAHRYTDATDEGTALHSMLLGAGRDVVLVEIDEVDKKGVPVVGFDGPVKVKPNDFRTHAAQRRRNEIRAAGGVPFLARDFDRLVKAASALRTAFHDAAISMQGEVEQVIVWTERADDGTEVMCKAMLDLVSFDTGRILDLKKTENAHPDAVARHVDDFGYAVQQAAYVSAMEKLRPALAGRVADLFSFAFYELDPVLVTQQWLDGSYRHIGEQRWRRAVNTWARCIRSRTWPGYPPGKVVAPPWVARREEEREMAEAEAAEKGRAA